MTFFLGIDLAAGSLKAVLIDAQARMMAAASAPLKTHHPASGHAEQNPSDWCAALKQVLGEIGNANHGFDALAGIAVSGGAHIGVLCDAQAAPLRPAIMWSDQRAHKEARQLAEAGRVEPLAYNRPNPTWTLAQLVWLQHYEPEILPQCQKFYFAKDWLRAQLTNDHNSDFGEAVGGMLADFKTGDWGEALLAESGLTRMALPTLISPSAQAGEVTPQAAETFGLPANVPVYQGSIDTSVEFLCCAPLAAQTASLKLASAGVLSFSGSEKIPQAPVSLYPHILPDAVYHAAGMNACTQAIDWVGRTLLGGLSAPQLAELAATAPPNANGVLFHPYLAGERAPLWNPSLTAQFSGLSRASGRGDMARASFEGVGHALTEIWHDMTTRLNHTPDRLHIMGGGAVSDFWCQMLADMLSVRLTRAEQTDCSFASALLAAHAHGRFVDLEEAAAAAYRQQGEFIPDKQNHAGYGEAHEKFIRTRSV